MTKRSAKSVHLQGILEAPGFNGFPTGGNLRSGVSQLENIPSFEVPDALVMKKLSNGRRSMMGHMPLHNEDVRPRVEALSKHFLQFGFDLSAPATETKRANCAETAMIPNEKPIPFYHDLADAQNAAGNQTDKAHESFFEDMGKRFPSIHEIKEKHGVLRVGAFKKIHGVARTKRMSDNLKPIDEYYDAIGSPEKESMAKFFDDYNRVREQQMLIDLVNKGYTEDEVMEFMRERRRHDIQKDAMTTPGGASIEAAIMAMRTMPTHLGAAGLTPQNANQLQSIQMLSKNAKKTGIVEGSALREVGEAYAMPGKLQQPKSRIESVHDLVDAMTGREKAEIGVASSRRLTAAETKSMRIKQTMGRLKIEEGKNVGRPKKADGK